MLVAENGELLADDGRLDLGLPISGNMDDPQFSYGAIVWKAIGNVLTKIVTSPFRALGSLFGHSGEKMEVINFDPGSAKLQQPELEKLMQVAQVLSKRTQLKLTVPGNYSEVADGTALRKYGLAVELTQRAGIKLDPNESPGPMDQGDPAIRQALRSLYTARFGASALERVQQGADPAKAPGTGTVYPKLLDQLEQNQPMAPQALAELGKQRAAAVIATLSQAGTNPANLAWTAAENVATNIDQPVPLKLGLAAMSDHR